MNFCFISDRDVVVDGSVGMNAHTVSDHHILTDGYVRIHEDFLRHMCAGIDDCRRIEVSLEWGWRVKKNQRARVSQIRIFSAQYRNIFAIDNRVLGDKDGGCARRLHSWRVAWVGKKCNLIGACLLKSSRCKNFDIAIQSLKARACLFGKFG